MMPQKQATPENHALQQAIACHQSGRIAEAISHYKKAMQTLPKHPGLLATLGGLLLQTGNLEESIRYNKLAVKIDPKQAIAFAHLGSAYAQLHRPLEALASCDRALALQPDFMEVYYNRGKVLEALSRYADAVASYDSALALKPDLVEAYYNRGNALQALQRVAEALSSYDQALVLNPDFAEVYSNRGNALKELNLLDAAIASYERAIVLKPDYAEAYNNLGMLFYKRKEFDSAWKSFERALALQPNLDYLYVLRVFCKLQVCDWQDLYANISELTAKLQGRKRISEPFITLLVYDNPALHRRVAEQWIADKFPPLPPSKFFYPEHTRIRVAYFSADFRDHPVAYLIAGLVETHRRAKFEIIAFSLGVESKDQVSARLEAGFDRFINAQHLSDQEVKQLAENLEIDIAVDLGGHTAEARTNLFAMRVAPIQVSYLGYPATMGADYMDYLIADKIVIPESKRQYYTENIVYLPFSFLVTDGSRMISAKKFSRKQFGLPEVGFVFCCFNNVCKITPDNFISWMRILDKVAGSVLWLPDAGSIMRSNLSKEAERVGIAAERLIFAARMPLIEEHLARLKLADLFLDTLPYNAHASASDALWAGLPVLTRIGESFASRVAASLLTAIGLPELITQSQEHYEALAIELASHSESLAAVKVKLAENRLATALFDTQQFAGYIESAFTQMYQSYRGKQTPEDIYISS